MWRFRQLLLAIATILGLAVPAFPAEDVIVFFRQRSGGELDARLDLPALETALGRAGISGQVSARFPFLNGAVIRLEKENERSRLVACPEVEAVVPAQLSFLATPPQHPGTSVTPGIPWHMRWARDGRITEGLPPQAWQRVCVVVLDSGLFPHPDFHEASLRWDLALDVFSGSRGQDAVRDRFGHGTAVTGALISTVVGIVPKAMVIPIRSASDHGEMGAVQIAAAIDHVLGLTAPGQPLAGIHVLVNFGYATRPAREPHSGYTTFLGTMLRRLEAADMLFVSSAGDDHSDADRAYIYPARITAPNFIACGATSSAGTLTSFSNYGRTSVGVGAPGKDIVSTIVGGSYAMGDSSSFSAAMVSGVTAALWARFPELSAWQVRNILLNATDAPLWMQAVGPFLPTTNLPILAGGFLRPGRTVDPAFVDASRGTAPVTTSTGQDTAGGSGGCSIGGSIPLFALLLFLPLVMGGNRR